MAKMDWDSIRQFILEDRKIKEYFLLLAGGENPMRAECSNREPISGIPSPRTVRENMQAAGYTSEIPVGAAGVQDEMQENSILALRSENRALRQELEDAQQHMAALEAELSKLRQADLAAQEKLQATLEKLTEFEPVSRAMELYGSLGEKSKDAMKNIFRASSPDGFISCGVQKNSLSNLWDYGRTLAADGSEDCLKIDGLFAYFVSLYNLTFDQPVYSLIEPQTGDRFDEDIHVCLTRGTRIQKISGVLLRGYRVNGKTINKALVK
ncbi:MAG: hypothetical protein K2N63_04930 [Lachnospiraceae bacterium]|nr:hypothetical protein [Lachnospiraceae bacterium]